MTMRLPQIARNLRVSSQLSLRSVRYASTVPPTSSASSSSSPSPSTPSSSRPVVEPTEFTGKSSPREVHERPEALRGLPPSSHKAPWETTGDAAASRASANGTEGNGSADFAGPSRPRMVYERPRDLPPFSNKMPMYVALAVLGLGAWGLFLLHATNQERLSSSVLRQVNFQLRNSPEVATLLGNNVRLAPNWWGVGDPYISGSINLMQGRIDLKFRVQGTKDAGTVFFTSIRPQQAAAWRIVRYKIIADGGEVVRLEDKFTNAATAAA